VRGAPAPTTYLTTTLTPAARHVPGQHGRTRPAAGGSGRILRRMARPCGRWATLARFPWPRWRSAGGLGIPAWTAVLAGFGPFPRWWRRRWAAFMPIARRCPPPARRACPSSPSLPYFVVSTSRFGV